jgi:hypothetical protein
MRIGVPGKIVADTLASRAMPLFWKPYKSDVTRFIDELKAKKPTLEAEQRAGRALLWDRPIDRDAESQYRDARVPQQPYVYQNKVR